MSAKNVLIASIVGAAGVAGAVALAPAASAQNDPCTVAVSTSRCLGPQGIERPSNPIVSPGIGAQNGPYGPWGSLPPLG